MSLRRIGAIARAEWLLNRRDPRSLVVIFILPVVLLILYGYGLNFDLRHLPLAVQDLDRSEVSRQILQRAAASGYFEIVTDIRRRQELAPLLRSRRALLALVVPPDFTERLGSGRPAHLQLLVDGSDAVTASTALGYAQGLVARLNQEVVQRRALRGGAAAQLRGAITARTQVLYNPGLRSAAFIVPGLMGVVMALLAALLTSTCIVREREVGTIEALLATPVRAAELMVGKLAPYALLALVGIGLSVGAGAVIFQVLPRGSLLELFGVSVVFIIACLLLGLTISGRAGSQRTAIVGGILSLMLPTVVLSGFVFPVANMPLALRAIANLLPATHYLVLVRAIYLRDVSVAVFWPNAAALAAALGVVFALAVRSFRARL